MRAAAQMAAAKLVVEHLPEYIEPSQDNKTGMGMVA